MQMQKNGTVTDTLPPQHTDPDTGVYHDYSAGHLVFTQETTHTQDGTVIYARKSAAAEDDRDTDIFLHEYMAGTVLAGMEQAHTLVAVTDREKKKSPRVRTIKLRKARSGF